MRRFIYERSPSNIRDWSPAYSFICMPEIETALPENETALPEIETSLPEIATSLPEIEILSY